MVYVVESADQYNPAFSTDPIQCPRRREGNLMIWQPEAGVELLLDARDRQTGDATACGLRWSLADGSVRQMVRRYDGNGSLLSLSPEWP